MIFSPYKTLILNKSDGSSCDYENKNPTTDLQYQIGEIKGEIKSEKKIINTKIK